MALIKSISGIRGTIGGTSQEGLNPQNIVQFVAGYATFIARNTAGQPPLIVAGRDARISGPMVHSIVVGTLQSMGCNVFDIGLATTPTTEMAVIDKQADGGIIITASHNPTEWNALKLLNAHGEFLSAADGKCVLQIANLQQFAFVPVIQLGQVEEASWLEPHVQTILNLEEVDVESIRQANFTVAFDAINSVGGIAVPYLLKQLGVQTILPLYDDCSGHFAHNPEPLTHHLTALRQLVQTQKAHVGFAVDPDVDRLAIIDENGNPFGEEYTLVAVADYLLGFHRGGNTVSNLSSTRALREVTNRHGGNYCAAAVGEVNVVTEMKKTNALIGGEGNGGVIFPKLHAGRDALLGIALFLTYLAKSKMKVSELRKQYPNYEMAKEKVQLPPQTDTKELFARLAEEFAALSPNLIDGIKIDFEDSWVQIRPSNTEPIVRVYTEAPTAQKAQDLAQEYIAIVQKHLAH